MDVATFFGVCVWLVPFFLFLSLSANDNVLPSQGESTPHIKTTAASENGSPAMTPADRGGSGLQIKTQVLQRSSILKVALDPLLSLIPRIGSGKFRSSRSQRGGLIASPSPSAPPSPSIYGGPSSPAYFGNAGPFSPQVANGMSAGYDASSLSPQTPFNNRFAEHAAIRGAASSPQLRSPPVPKRSATSPAGAIPAMYNGGAQMTPTRSPGPQDVSMHPLPPPSSSQPEAVSIGSARSASPFAGASQGATGLVSRRKNL